MKLKKIICLLLCFTMILPCAVSFETVALAQNSSEGSAETTFNFDEFDFSDPSLRIPNFPKDDEFFGEWDSENNVWIQEPKFNYEHISQYGGYDLKAVEAAAKSGNYETAKEELLEYYRLMNKQRGMEVLAETTSNKNLSSLLLYNMHDMVSSSYHLADIFSVGCADWETVSIDMLETVEYYIGLGSTTTLPIGLYALTKDGYEAVFYSNDSDYAPYLEMVVNGVTETLPAENATYIRAGDYVNDNFDGEEYMYSCESETTIGQRDPVDSGTKRAFLTFDLSEYDSGDTITAAQLVLKGKCRKTDGVGDPSYRQKVAAIGDINTNWAEETLTWETNATAIFSYEGELGVNWIQPTKATNADQVYEEHLIRFAWLPALTSSYTNSGDETYARAFFMYLHDFIEETYNVYRGMEGGWEYPEAHNSVEEAMALLYGGYSKSLDLSVRADNVTKYLPYYFDSEYMTPELFTVFIKYEWAMGELLSRFFGRSEKAGNWGNYSNKGFFSIMAYHPEFVNACDCTLEEGEEISPWRKILYERVDSLLKGRFLEDGSSEEGSTSYTWSNLNNLYATKTIADKLGIELDYPQSAKDSLKKLTDYCMQLLLPWGGDPGFGDCVPHTGDYFPNVYNMGKWLDIPEFLYVGSRGKEGTAPDYTSVYYDYRKFMMMRSAWKDDALYLYTSNSSSPYSHNHWDDLNIIVAAYGAYLLIDPGYYTLETNDLNGRNLKSSLSHNTLSINGYCTRKYTAPHLTGDAALPKDGIKGDFEYVEFNDHYDFVREVTENNKSIQYLSDPKSTDPESEAPPFEPGMDSARNILFLRPNFWIVSDYMKPVDEDGPDGNGNTYSQFWHTLPNSNLSIDGQYVLKQGETIGDINEGEFASQIENTHFVPGTGDGTLSTNVHSTANILVVPADIKESESDSGVTPKLLRGLYSPMKGSVTTTPFGVFERTEKGTTVFDTVLFPTRKGEKYDITTTPFTLSLPQGAGSSFGANIKNISGNNNDDYNFSYYILHELDKQTDVEFGDYSTDGMLAYYEEEQDSRPRNAIMKNATYLGDEANDYKILYSEEAIEDISVKWENGEILIASADENLDLSKLTVYSYYNPTKVLLNGEEVSFTYESKYVYFGDMPLLNGDTIILPGTPSVDDTTSTPEDTTTHGKPSDSTGGGGGGGGGGAISKDEKPENKDDEKTENKDEEQNENSSTAYEKELENHWGKSEIESLIEKEIVKGDGNTLSLKSDITRAEFTAMVLRALNIEEAPYKNAFSDVSENDWYAGIMQAAYDKGIIAGTDSGAEPNAPLTREQAVKIIITALGAELSDDKEQTQFTDADEISDWAKEYVSKAVSMGIINGMGDGKFAPKGTTLREQAMVMIYRILNLEEETIK